MVERVSEEEFIPMKYEFFKKIGYKPHDGQNKFHRATARFRIIAGGTRWGKSMAAGYDVCPRLLLPNNQGWIVGPTYRLGEKEFRYIWQALIIDLKLPTVRANNNLNIGDMYIEFPWGSWVRVMSSEKPANLLGEELDWLILAEGSQIKEQVYTRYLRGRLVSRKGILIANTTPNEQDKLIYPMFKKGQDRRFTDYYSAQYGTADNPYVDKKEIEDAKKDLPEDEFREQYLGEFIPLGTKSVFEKDILYNMLEGCPDEVKIYTIAVSISGSVINPKLSWEMIEDNTGEFEVYEEPINGESYVIGCDVAEDDTPQGDFSSIHVIKQSTGEEIAHWHGNIDSDTLAYTLAAIGYYYNEAAIGVEYNNMGSAVCNEIKKVYSRLYRRVKHDTKSKKNERKRAIGWYTSKKTKPILVKDLSSAIKNGELRPLSRQTIHELLSFGRDKDGKLKGLGSSNDDRVMGLGIAWQVNLQFNVLDTDDKPVDYSYYDNLAGVAQ